MPPAARVGDPENHGTPLAPGPGSPDVLIGGKPAWRAFVDFAACPMTCPGTPPPPHVGGVVVDGEPTVLINGFPAATEGDKIPESCTMNGIKKGEKSVDIG